MEDTSASHVRSYFTDTGENKAFLIEAMLKLSAGPYLITTLPLQASEVFLIMMAGVVELCSDAVCSGTSKSEEAALKLLYEEQRKAEDCRIMDYTSMNSVKTKFFTMLVMFAWY
ncbi:hypothetical protein llap_16355 [Limosa lapponica baueri]|uniref:Uncharacterized protein n=1 Tax=Limosa lapponica baueri TaxID=1758121 RepID=A0A2I0THR8_LIMLA|nr:hypothetical protein llap_16355 [Limosa lapponica baueri]